MLPLKLQRQDRLKILCLGAHCDDIEIGCGGTLMRLSEEYGGLQVKWVIFTSNPEREKEARKSAGHFLQKITEKDVVVLNFRDGFLPFEAMEVKDYFEGLKSFQPDVIFTHFRHDLHQDHRLICDLTWNTFRDHLILEYEIPKYDGDLGHPNFFIPLESAVATEKVDALHRYYPSQSGKHWFDKETFFALMRIRGLESVSKSRYAEGFYLRKAVLN
jgi:LmbE family N-acetylglucosaminyl deacetylase